jgi:hypothetical protein
VRLISAVLPVGPLHQPRKWQRPAPDRPTGKIEAEDPEAATGRAYNQSNITAPDLGRFFCVRKEFKNSKVDMSLSEPLRASAQHIELLQDKRRRLSDALVSAELQFLAALRRECLDGGMTWAQLREAYSVLSAVRLPGLRACWMDAVPVSPEDVILNARREAAVGAGGVWRETPSAAPRRVLPAQRAVGRVCAVRRRPASGLRSHYEPLFAAVRRPPCARQALVELDCLCRRQHRGARDPGPVHAPVPDRPEPAPGPRMSESKARPACSENASGCIGSTTQALASVRCRAL